MSKKSNDWKQKSESQSSIQLPFLGVGEETVNEIDKCFKCEISGFSGKKILWRQAGNLRSKRTWVFVGEAPGRTEYLLGEPFVGPSGKLLDDMLRDSGAVFKVRSVILNSVLCTPFTDESKSEIRTPSNTEIKNCGVHLRSLIESIKPDCLIALGKVPSKSLEMIGLDHLKLPHPASILRRGRHSSVDYKRAVLWLKKMLTE